MVNKRIDAYYYQPKFKAIAQVVENVQFDVLNLGDLIHDISSGSTPKVDENYYTDASGVPFLRVQNVMEQGLDLNDAKFITREVHNDMLKRSQLKKDDLAFTITGRIGSVAVIPDNFEGNINQHSVRFQLNSQIANTTPSYVAAFLNSTLGRSLSIREATGGTRLALDYKALHSIKIILPPPNIQNRIVSFMRSAYAQRKQKEQEADALLDSIDDYMTEELGLEMPVIKEGRCFAAYAGLLEDRIDPLYVRNIPYFTSLKASYPLISLRKLLVAKPQYGASERAVDGDPDSDFRYIRITDIDDCGNLLDDWQTAEETDLKYMLENDDVLFARSGSAGQAFVYKSKFGKSIFGGYLIRFKFDPTKVNPSFVFHYTLTKVYKLWVHSVQRTTVQANINSKEFQSLEIPLPPLDAQNRIVAEVNRRLTRISELKQETDAIVEAAKERVEQILLQ